MTRRIAIAILVTALVVLLLGAAAAYLATRAILLADLDESLMARATALLQLHGASGGERPGVPPEDRFILRNEQGQTLARPPIDPVSSEPPRVVSKGFVTLAGGGRLRSVTLDAALAPAAPGDPQRRVTLVYSTSADRFDRALRRLALSLIATCALAGLLTAAAAWRITRAALAPLHDTARTIGGIDERHLDRRVDCTELPPELRPMGEQLNQMLARLEEVFAQRRRFLADAAHELRTPVAALLTTLEVSLRRPRDAAALTTTLQNCLASARMLRRLVDALLSQARGEAPAPSAPQPVDVPALLRQCAALAEGIASGAGVQVTCSAPERLEAVLHADRLQSVVTGLLDNAVQYNRPGGRVELACGATDQGIWISVSDTGVGIPPDALPHVFEPFYRADPAANGGGGHLGLGLHLVKSQVDAMGGTCGVRSTLGAGTTFRIELPCVLAVAA